MKAELTTRRGWLQAAAGAALAATTGVGAQPGVVTRVLVGFPAGGGSDAIARLLAQHLQAVSNQRLPEVLTFAKLGVKGFERQKDYTAAWRPIIEASGFQRS